MPIRVDLLAFEPNIPGQARLAVKKWQGASEGLEFSIQRNQDQLYLQGNQQWSNNPFWFQISQFKQGDDGEVLEAPVGPELVDPLLENSGSSNFRMELRELDGGLSDQGVVRPAQGLLSSSAGGDTRSIYDGGELSVVPETLAAPEIPDLPELTLPEPEPAPERVSVEPVGAQAASPAPVTSKRNLVPLFLGVLILLAVTLGLWFWLKKPVAEATLDVAPAPGLAITSESGAAGPCTLESMASQSELSFVQNCIREAPDSAALLEIITTAKQAGHCGIAQRLYANRAQAGDVQIAHAYAREYDPQFHQPSTCFAEPDAATAAYWYETILVSDPDDVQAAQRFEELQP
ncbi:hypothetical protein BN1049_00105 [Pseudomonas saudimassiliensis]|uniref:Transmembrane protein n=1 Tax=Pseudomonas saudimassiliensis TaxID=1461581 RepID=A0A078M7B2_9PSED|nr:hypothetical protein [Pseudomonas saudimassiliensis]CEA00586.1 hypothetical protein BN1049_00105 [Pseudomonas saudimassiliensis]CEF25203.1 hypothetical protein BN1049_00105 [Pseudomonas saudimassiliensis]